MLGIKYELQQTCKNIAKAQKGEGMALMYHITQRCKIEAGVRTSKDHQEDQKDQDGQDDQQSNQVVDKGKLFDPEYSFDAQALFQCSILISTACE